MLKIISNNFLIHKDDILDKNCDLKIANSRRIFFVFSFWVKIPSEREKWSTIRLKTSNMDPGSVWYCDCGSRLIDQVQIRFQGIIRVCSGSNQNDGKGWDAIWTCIRKNTIASKFNPYHIRGGGGKLSHVTQKLVKIACVFTIITLLIWKTSLFVTAISHEKFLQ